MFRRYFVQQYSASLLGFWSQLPPELRRSVFPAGSVTRQWPLESEAAESHGWNVELQALEDRLLEVAQAPPYADSIELCAAPYGAEEHRRVTRQAPFHALLLADGPEAQALRDGALREHFGLDEAYPRGPPQDYVQVMFDLGGRPARRFSLAASTVVSLAQKRYSLSACGAGGHISMVLTEAEKKELSVTVAASEQVKLRVEEGLRLFGVPEEAVCGTSIHRALLLKRLAYCAELRDCEAPAPPPEPGAEADAEPAMPHPYAFLVGEAADMTIGWPGSRLRTSLKGVAKAVDSLVALRQGLCAGWSDRASAVSEYNQAMMLLQADAAGVGSQHSAVPKVVQRTLQEGKRGKKAEAAQGFLAAVKAAHVQLSAGGLPPERAEELPPADELCKGLAAEAVGAATLRVLGATGPWLAAPAAPRQEAQGAGQTVRPPRPEVSEGAPEPGEAGGEPPKAAYNRGVRLLKGKGVERDREQAAACFQAAAQQGHREAQYALAVMFLKGDGIKKDRRRLNGLLLGDGSIGDPPFCCK